MYVTTHTNQLLKINPCNTCQQRHAKLQDKDYSYSLLLGQSFGEHEHHNYSILVGCLLSFECLSKLYQAIVFIFH